MPTNPVCDCIFGAFALIYHKLFIAILHNMICTYTNYSEDTSYGGKTYGNVNYYERKKIA